MKEQITILGFAGSLRKGSYNKSLLRAAHDLLPERTTLETFDIDGIPLYNADIEANLPAKVKEFKEKIRGADAIVIATPEYNHSMPGVIKNAIDWATRGGDNSFSGKPVAIMGASDGWNGTQRSQYHLRQVLTALNMHAVNTPQVTVSYADKKIDKNGVMTDEDTKKKISKLLEKLADLTRKLSG